MASSSRAGQQLRREAERVGRKGESAPSPARVSSWPMAGLLAGPLAPASSRPRGLTARYDAHRPAARAFIRWHHDPGPDPQGERQVPQSRDEFGGGKRFGSDPVHGRRHAQRGKGVSGS